MVFVSFLYPTLGRGIGYISGCTLHLDVLLNLREDVPYFGDLMLHQVLVEGVGDLQPTDERDSSHIVIVLIHQSHLVLKITDILLEIFPEIYLDGEKVVAIFL